MVRVTVNMVPLGTEQPYSIGEILIANDTSSRDIDDQHYDFALSAGNRVNSIRCTGRVENHVSESGWIPLLERILALAKASELTNECKPGNEAQSHLLNELGSNQFEDTKFFYNLSYGCEDGCTQVPLTNRLKISQHEFESVILDCVKSAVENQRPNPRIASDSEQLYDVADDNLWYLFFDEIADEVVDQLVELHGFQRFECDESAMIYTAVNLFESKPMTNIGPFTEKICKTLCDLYPKYVEKS